MWQSAETLFLSILLESLPFILFGVLISSLIQELVSPATLFRFLPKRRALAVPFAALCGLVVPVCDCGTLPVARSLLVKGAPFSTAMSFTLAAPVVNPLTMAATYVAFGMDAHMMWMRTLTTLGIAIGVGWVLVRFEGGSTRRSQQDWREHRFDALHMHEELPMLETAAAHSPRASRRPLLRVIGGILEHAIIEFFEVGVFVVISAAVAAVLQTMVPASFLSTVSQHPFWSIPAMMLLAVLLSLCSEADAFVARSLAGITTTGGVLSFLVIGQMIDLRNLLLLPRTFPRWVVINTFVLVTMLTLYAGIWVNLL